MEFQPRRQAAARSCGYCRRRSTPRATHADADLAGCPLTGAAYLGTYPAKTLGLDTAAWMSFDGYSVSRHQLHGLFNVPETHPRTPLAGRAPHADVLA